MDYYYLDSENQKQGPFTREQLVEQDIDNDTLVWRAGLKTWTRADILEDLEPVLTIIESNIGTPPPLPAAYNPPPLPDKKTKKAKTTEPKAEKKEKKVSKANVEKAKKKIKKKFTVCPKTWKGESIFIMVLGGIALIFTFIGNVMKAGATPLYLVGCFLILLFGGIAYYTGRKVEDVYYGQGHDYHSRAAKKSLLANTFMQIGFWIAAVVFSAWWYYLMMWPYNQLTK